MENNNAVQKIRAQYAPKERTELDALKQLDKKAKAPANIFAYSFGTLAALILGSGMSLIMTDISQIIGIAHPVQAGLVIGIAGLIMAIANYPIYKLILNSRRKKYADDIFALSDKIARGE